ncbi:MAG TPA: hypothetical protein VF516_32355, partial [Kofleriaceae bacterium]
RRRRAPRRCGMTRRPAPPPSGARSIWLAALLGLALGVGLPAGCVVRRFTGPEFTGTCDGACAHYMQCKPGHASADRDRCLAECPDVFSDRDSLMQYESLACQDAVEYIDGSTARTAAHR